MELELIKLIWYGFGSVFILLLIFISVLAGLLVRYIRNEDSEDF